jgi:hypothetical protein
MKHILLTRFNILMPGWPSQLHLNPDWLDGRFKLFEDMCLPSVAAQTNQNFDWLIFFDSHTPEKYKLKIEALVNTYKFHPIFMDIFDLELIKAKIAEAFAGKSMLLTSRLDTDDLIAVDYIEKLQTRAIGVNVSKVYNFDCGACISIKKGNKALYEHEDVSNPFASLLEPFTNTFTTVLVLDHTVLQERAEIVHMRDKGMWLQLVHGGNFVNRVRGKRINIGQYNDKFIYLKSLSSGVRERSVEIFFDNYILGAFRYLKEFLRALAKKPYRYFKSI